MNNVLGFALNLSHDWLKKELKKEKLSDKFGAEALLAGVMENKITIIASGLMRLYRFRNQRIELLKGEQSYARFKNYEGAVSGKNIAMSLIGASDSIDPQIFEETVFPNDIYLFLSYPAYADIPVEKARKELSLLSGSHPREEEKRLLKQAVRRILGEIRYQNDRDNLSLGLAKIL
jgi:hypothetical protein